MEQNIKSSNFTPLVSIIIPVYNGANYMREAIDSALAQTYPHVEVLVINDGSKDNGATDEIAHSYGNKIRYFHKENGGVATALNLGIKEMKGQYFSWLSHDDVYLPEKINLQIEVLANQVNKNIVLYTDVIYINEASEITHQYHIPTFPKEHFRPMFCLGGIINGCTLLVPKKCFDSCGLFNPQLRTTQDADMWFRISEKFDFLHLKEATTLSRVHLGQDTVKLSNIAVKEQDELYCYFLDKLSEDEIQVLYKNNVTMYYINFAKKMQGWGFKEAYHYAIELGFKSILLHPSKDWGKTLVKLIDIRFPMLTARYIRLKSLFLKSSKQ